MPHNDGRYSPKCWQLWHTKTVRLFCQLHLCAVVGCMVCQKLGVMCRIVLLDLHVDQIKRSQYGYHTVLSLKHHIGGPENDRPVDS
jgi:hypothetical protein